MSSENALAGPDGEPMPGGPLPDAALVAYAENVDKLWRTAAVALRPHGLVAYAEDVVQNAMLSLLKKSPPRVDNWAALMVTAVKYRAIDLLRAKAIMHERPDDLQFEGHKEPHPVNLNAELVETVVLEADELEQRVAAVRTAIATLPTKEREVIEKIFYEKESQVNIARDMGVTTGRVSQLKKAALSRLAAELEGNGVGS